MKRPYDDIPRQGEHLKDPVDAEPTTNVRAQEAVHPTSRDKQAPSDERRAEREYVLLMNDAEGLYRLHAVSAGAEPDPQEGFEVVHRIPEAGDLEGLYRRIPEAARYAVFEHGESGEVFYSPERIEGGDWTSGAKFDRVTIFTDADTARTYERSRHEGSGS